MKQTVGMVSLGCAKNQVCSEQMLFLLREAGYPITGSLAEADALVINTCAFIESAKTEAIDNILEFAQLKREGRLRHILMAGCLAERYREEILAELPEVDGLIGCGSFTQVVRALEALEAGQTPTLFGDISAPLEETGRIVTTGPGWAYLRIAEGCDNRCAYCVIPAIRGRYRSRPLEHIVAEAKALAADGARELIVIAQDVTRYGMDLYGEKRLPDLIRALAGLEDVVWIRLHYLYPDLIDDALIRAVADEPKVVKYLDIPIQHIDDGILRRMNRRGTGAEIEALLTRLRREIPGLVLRTSLITGLPGEGEAEFEALCAFLRRAKLERAGVFAYSPEEGTPAYDMERPDAETALRRAELAAELQSRVMDEYNESRLGQTLEVIAEDYDRLAECWFGRSYADSPEVDGKVFFTGRDIRPGSFYRVRITDILDGDLLGECVQPGHAPGFDNLERNQDV